MRALGVPIAEVDAATLQIDGVGLAGLQEPVAPLDCVNSGTTMRLLAGLLAGQEFFSILNGHEQLIKRPMGRIVEPLRRMGAANNGRQEGRLAPLAIQGTLLQGIDYTLPVASAQVKSAVLLAGLYGRGLAIVREPGPARDHTERILTAMGAPIRVLGPVITSERPQRPLRPLDLTVPGDLSSAAFLIAAGLLVPQSRVVVAGVGVNPTRTGLLDVLREMGADLQLENERVEAGEPVADLIVQHGELRGVEVGGTVIPRAIDELPVLAVVATQAHGRTLVRDAAELRVKETDRIATVAAELRKMGAHVEERPDGFVVEGPTPLRSAPVWSHGDHRLAMALAVAALVASGPVLVEDVECIGDSFPGFETALGRLGVTMDVV
jgi:3-phosphoshikimate 1-carboxyvinyltransferase